MKIMSAMAFEHSAAMEPIVLENAGVVVSVQEFKETLSTLLIFVVFTNIAFSTKPSMNTHPLKSVLIEKSFVTKMIVI